MLTPETLDSFLCETPLDYLPETFQDAVYITPELDLGSIGIPFASSRGSAATPTGRRSPPSCAPATAMPTRIWPPLVRHVRVTVCRELREAPLQRAAAQPISAGVGPSSSQATRADGLAV
ncbi:uncharacterized protein DNG_10053 [Cephalotrichum gorgonifer]|uniref:Uncharacterized protein n=1 Tax=Cephalotrichum gorgonifer TaxID=2041049 RepID=A0AAE8N7V8_9PEZI|nr:uncharacterized protein DNG_10053 [Cephalotrichum gorgonifer]